MAKHSNVSSKILLTHQDSIHISTSWWLPLLLSPGIWQHTDLQNYKALEERSPLLSDSKSVCSWLVWWSISPPTAPSKLSSGNSSSKNNSVLSIPGLFIFLTAIMLGCFFLQEQIQYCYIDITVLREVRKNTAAFIISMPNWILVKISEQEEVMKWWWSV